MTNTHVIHETTRTNTDSGMGFFVGIILLLIFLFIFLYYGLPLLRNTGGSASPQLNVPNKIDINVNPNNGAN